MLDGLAIFTVVHVAISLVGIVSGVPFVFEVLTSKKLSRWTSIYLVSTILTSVTGFMFPADRITPAHLFGVLSLISLGIAVYSLYARKLQGKWSSTFVLSGIFAFYLNAFVLIVQLFLKVKVLNAIAPTQTEPAFVVAQATLLLAFVLLTIFSLRQYRPAI